MHKIKGMEHLPKLSTPNKYTIWTKSTILCYVVSLLAVILAGAAVKLYMTQVNPPAFISAPRLEVAHRGYSYSAPENTVAAFKRAVTKNVKAVEIDVMVSKDGVIVVGHDYTLDTFTNGTGLVWDLTWAQLKHLQVTRGGAGNSHNVEDIKLARLETIVAAAKELGVNLMVELKSVGQQTILVKSVVDILRSYNYVEHCVISSFFPGILMEINRLCPEAYTLLLYSHRGFRMFCNNSPASLRTSFFWSTACANAHFFDTIGSYLVEPVAKFVGVGAVGIDIDNPHFDTLATRAIGWGLKVFVWTVNSITQKEMVYNLVGNQNGAVAMISDCPNSHCPSEIDHVQPLP